MILRYLTDQVVISNRDAGTRYFSKTAAQDHPAFTGKIPCQINRDIAREVVLAALF
jgi:hypothetical protein